ncbi:unnamed protein product [Urochloa humidicola]
MVAWELWPGHSPTPAIMTRGYSCLAAGAAALTREPGHRHLLAEAAAPAREAGRTPLAAGAVLLLERSRARPPAMAGRSAAVPAYTLAWRKGGKEEEEGNLVQINL